MPQKTSRLVNPPSIMPKPNVLSWQASEEHVLTPSPPVPANPLNLMTPQDSPSTPNLPPKPTDAMVFPRASKPTMMMRPTANQSMVSNSMKPSGPVTPPPSSPAPPPPKPSGSAPPTLFQPPPLVPENKPFNPQYMVIPPSMVPSRPLTPSSPAPPPPRSSAPLSVGAMKANQVISPVPKPLSLPSKSIASLSTEGTNFLSKKDDDADSDDTVDMEEENESNYL
jgi:hypothetical protein